MRKQAAAPGEIKRLRWLNCANRIKQTYGEVHCVISRTLTLAVPDCLGTSEVATARSALASQSLGFGVCCAGVQYQTCWVVLVACLYASHGRPQCHASLGLDHCVLDEAASQGVEASGCFLEHCHPST